VQQSKASTSNHATRHTHSQDTTAIHPSGKLVNYKRLVCYEHCPGTFRYTFVLIKFEAWKYVDPFFNKQDVFHKVFVMEGEPVNSEFCIQVSEWLSKLMPKRKAVTFAQCSYWFFHDNEMFYGNLQCFRDQPLNVSNIFILPEVKITLRWRRFPCIEDARKNRATKLYVVTWVAIDDVYVTFRKMWKCCSQGRLLRMKIK